MSHYEIRYNIYATDNSLLYNDLGLRFIRGITFAVYTAQL